jgi:hypothetical protein
MIYIDDYNSKVINNGPPKKEDREILADTKKHLDSRQQAIFWYLAGVTIGSNYEDVKTLLSKYGYDVSNEQDAATAIAEMIGTPKWTKFVLEFGNLIEESVDENVFNKLEDGAEESSWVQALIGAIGSIGGSSLGLAKSSKDKKAAEVNAKSAMFTGITNVLVEKQRLDAEREKTLREEKKGTIWIVIAVVVVLLVIIGFVVYKRMKAKAIAN